MFPNPGAVAPYSVQQEHQYNIETYTRCLWIPCTEMPNRKMSHSTSMFLMLMLPSLLLIRKLSSVQLQHHKFTASNTTTTKCYSSRICLNRPRLTPNSHMYIPPVSLQFVFSSPVKCIIFSMLILLLRVIIRSRQNNERESSKSLNIGEETYKSNRKNKVVETANLKKFFQINRI